jgi:hypothetical protein
MDQIGLISLPERSPEFWHEVDLCEKVRAYTESCFKGLVMYRRAALYGAYISLAQEHFASMILLVRSYYPAAASALARPHFEACCRGMWIYLKATEEQVDKAFSWKMPSEPTMARMLDDIDTGYGGEGMFRNYHMNWKIPL